MTVRTSDVDSSVMFADRQGVGVRHSAGSLLEYDLTVIAVDAADVVRAAGGWLCDRARAGWRVNVLLTADADVRPFQVLGVRTMSADIDPVELVRSNPAALAISADLLDAHQRLRTQILRVLERGGTELTVWGQWQSGVLAGRVAPTRHRLSGAARAFKTQALAVAGSPCSAIDSAEDFYSCSLWYPPEGSDLMPVG